jgi:phosphoribosylamine-glycine ligase
MISMIGKNEKIVNIFCEKLQSFNSVVTKNRLSKWINKDLREAREQAYAMVKQIQFQAVHYRTDIAAKALHV